MRLGAYLLLKLDKCLLTPTVIAQVGDIFKQHQIEQCARRWRFGLAIHSCQAVDYFFEM